MSNRKLSAYFLLGVIVFQLLQPTISFALTSGPSQPEVQTFQPAGTSDMVDLFSGDFSYNIPLFELPGPNGGYPFSLSYQSGIGTDQEASWVGLGWNLQPGAINRQMRGLPDEFNGVDKIQTKMSMAPSVTAGAGIGAGLEIFGGDALSMNIGLSAYQNNYRGAGYTIDGSLGFGKSSSSGATGGLGFSLDSNEGVSLSPSLSLGTKNINIGLGIGYNSKQGLTSLSFDGNLHTRWTQKSKKISDNKTESKQHTFAFGGGTSLSLTNPGYTPQITTPMISSSFSATVKVGGAFWGIFGSPYITGFYNEQKLATDKRWISTPGYGYLNYEKAAQDPNSLMDINREKDGVVDQTSPNLPIPSLTYDIYSVAGQGLSAMYRPFRSDYGTTKDQQVSSESSGASGGVDLGPALIHVGANLSLNFAKSTSGFWDNAMSAKAKFGNSQLGSLYEPVYFKAHGEPGAEAASKLESIGGEQAVRVRLTGEKGTADATSQLQYGNRDSWAAELPTVDKREPRKTRNQTIQSYTNAQLLNGTAEVLPHFQIWYIDGAGNEVRFVRNTSPEQSHHTAAYTATTPEGLRYNYGIPAYNLSQEEITFSCKEVPQGVHDPDFISIESEDWAADDEPRYNYGTENYLRRVKTPAYAHAHLLTSILGPDYVDVTGDGVTQDDLGYWVKFTYQQTATKDAPFKWRDPFMQAHFQQGWKSDPRDDKGSFVYGEKEMWYLRRAETRSHIAEFSISARDDGRGVDKKLQNNKTTLGRSVYRLDKITLYTRFANPANAIKSVRFQYVEDVNPEEVLCKGADNSSITTKNPRGGKLTLKKLWFEYGGSSRGSLNPYVFSYNSLNPDYKLLSYDGWVSYDRWGNYKPANANPGGVTNNVFPYVSQDPTKKAQIDSYAAAWSLSEIQLPSGGTIKVDYESDDYAYVQHKQAMQMTEVVSPTGDTNADFILDDTNQKVRFKLKQAIDKTTVTQDISFQRNEVLKYIDETTYQLYFKFLISLRNPGENVDEYISGYVDIEKGSGNTMILEEGASGKYEYGSFYVMNDNTKSRTDNSNSRNPFSMRAWQHLRTNQPELAKSGASMPPAKDTGEKINRIMAVGSIFGEIEKMFEGFYNYCAKPERNWGRGVRAGRAWVRLKSPDKMKYGGGLRVKQITMKDNWAQDEEGVYGQVYDYTTKEEVGGPDISSGVAAYEPIVGGEENPLRYAKKYTQSVPLRADNNLYFEYPINESYYPGASVGYSKVTVTSLASASLAGKTVNNSVFPSGTGVSFGTSGKTVHEFFTAKDFPVFTDETEKENKPYKLAFNIPLLGSVSISNLTTSQGYSIVTNDMHGKQKKVSNYRQTPTGQFEPEPISWVRYNYATTPRYYQQEKVLALANKFVDNNDGSLSLAQAGDTGRPQYTLGQESEFFMDMRKFEDNAYTGGVRLNVDVLFFFFFTIPAFVPWPNVTSSENQLRTAVTNKVIFKSGILQSVEAYDGGSLVKTENLKWDKQTGAVVLTSVNNNFDARVYSYNILAYNKYQGMGAAYQNSGLTFSVSNVNLIPFQTNQFEFTVKEYLPEGTLYAGDELLLTSQTGTPLAIAVYIGEENGIQKLTCEGMLAGSYKALIVRSGYRNQLSVSAGSITALEDPSTSTGTKATFSKTIQVPK